jgi:hypothetical protein
MYVMPFDIKDEVFLSDIWDLILWHTVTERYTFSLRSFTQYLSKLACTYFINRWAKFFGTFSSLHFTFSTYWDSFCAHNNWRNAYWIALKFVIKEFYARLCNYVYQFPSRSDSSDFHQIYLHMCLWTREYSHPCSECMNSSYYVYFCAVAEMLGDHKSCVNEKVHNNRYSMFKFPNCREWLKSPSSDKWHRVHFLNKLMCV